MSKPHTPAEFPPGSPRPRWLASQAPKAPSLPEAHRSALEQMFDYFG